MESSFENTDALAHVDQDEVEEILARMDLTDGLSSDDMEELARRVIVLLRRELVIERERLGHYG